MVYPIGGERGTMGTLQEVIRVHGYTVQRIMYNVLKSTVHKYYISHTVYHMPKVDYTVYIVKSTSYSVHCTVYILQCTSHSVYCTLYNVQCTLDDIHCIVYIVQCIQYGVHCSRYTVHCTLYIVQCIQYSVQCTRYSEHVFAIKLTNSTITINTRPITPDLVLPDSGSAIPQTLHKGILYKNIRVGVVCRPLDSLVRLTHTFNRVNTSYTIQCILVVQCILLVG